MAVNKLSNGKGQAQDFPNGRDGRRVRRQFATKGEVLAFERHLKEQVQDKPCLAMGNPLATEFNAKLFTTYTEQRFSRKPPDQIA